MCKFSETIPADASPADAERLIREGRENAPQPTEEAPGEHTSDLLNG